MSPLDRFRKHRPRLCHYEPSEDRPTLLWGPLDHKQLPFVMFVKAPYPSEPRYSSAPFFRMSFLAIKVRLHWSLLF